MPILVLSLLGYLAPVLAPAAQFPASVLKALPLLNPIYQGDPANQGNPADPANQKKESKDKSTPDRNQQASPRPNKISNVKNEFPSPKSFWTEQKPQWIVIDFWASWCEPCRESIPFYESQMKKWQSKNILWIGINEDSDRQEALNFLKKHSSSATQLFDQNQKLAQSLGIDTLPRLYILNSDFEIIWSQKAYTSELKKKIETQFQKIFEKP